MPCSLVQKELQYFLYFSIPCPNYNDFWKYVVLWHLMVTMWLFKDFLSLPHMVGTEGRGNYNHKRKHIYSLLFEIFFPKQEDHCSMNHPPLSTETFLDVIICILEYKARSFWVFIFKFKEAAEKQVIKYWDEHLSKLLSMN